MFTKTGFLMSGVALCSAQIIHRTVPCQLTLTRTDFSHVCESSLGPTQSFCVLSLMVHQSTIGADKDVSAKNINLGPGSYGRMVVWSGVVRSGVVGS